ncbi:ATP-binding cassette domain-containing protein (plasmid) [Pediococcus pentosaceus]|uniref:ATP-binding cassette domain-containing protein n=1 Tax=Pediococcus pentosaceus TaxID=1255 RepID=UPI003AF3F0E5
MEITLKNISFSYKNVAVLDNLSCTFRSGKLNYLIGYNGAGKSTLFDIMSGALKQKKGEIIGKPDVNEILYQTQNPAVFGALTGKNLQDFIFGVSTGHRDILLDNLPTHFVDLYKKLLSRKIGDMSVGERRWIITFLESYLNKEMFLLDEPTSGVDPVSKGQINKTLLSSAKNSKRIVIVTTHELRDMEQNSYVHLLNNKKIKSFNSYEDFVSASKIGDVEDAFSSLTSQAD